MNPTSKRNPSPFLPAFFFKSTFTTWHSNISWETKCSFEDHMDKMVCHSGGIPVKTWWANTFWYIEALLTRRAAVPPLFFSPPAFGGCYWKPWLQALIVYFVLPFFRGDLHMTMLLVWQTKQARNSIGAPPNYQDDQWATPQITARFVKQKHVKMLLFVPWIMYNSNLKGQFHQFYIQMYKGFTCHEKYYSVWKQQPSESLSTKPQSIPNIIQIVYVFSASVKILHFVHPSSNLNTSLQLLMISNLIVTLTKCFWCLNLTACRNQDVNHAIIIHPEDLAMTANVMQVPQKRKVAPPSQEKKFPGT